MTRLMLVDAVDIEETRVAITEHGELDHFDFVSKSKKQIKGNIYLAKITRIEPSLQAAFVEYGSDKQGFLPFSEVHPDYYQIPVEDRQRLLDEAAGLHESDDEADDEGQDMPDAKDTQKSSKPRIRKRGSSRRKTFAKKDDTSNDEPQESDDNQMVSQDQSTDSESSDSEDNNTQHSSDTHPLASASNVIAEEDDKEASQTESSDADNAQTEKDDADDATPKKRTRQRRRRGGKKSSSSSSSDSAQEDQHDDDSHKDEPVSSGMDDDVEEEIRTARNTLSRRYKIQEVMRPGQIVLVQVTKEERGNKGVSLSTYISLAGRYCVLMPNSPKAGGISRKIGNNEDRKRLRSISDELKSLRGMSAIIRTAGIDRTRAEIKRDYEYLIKLWNQIRDNALASIAPAVVYEENDIVKRSIRDHYNGDIEAIHVQGEASYRQAKDFMKLLMPSHAPRVKQHKDEQPVFTVYGVEAAIGELYKTSAPLKSGGYLVINPTEALISVDVNSGKSTNERNVEETAYKTNLEACEELARQLRLRNLGGLVVVDFIDMAYHKYRRNVEKCLKEAMSTDRAKVQIGHISSFGLLEMSRQRIGSSLEESTTQTCPNCQGSGRVPLLDVVVIQLLRNLQCYLSDASGNVITLHVNHAVMMELINHHREAVTSLESAYDVSLCFALLENETVGSYHFTSPSDAMFDSEKGFTRKPGQRKQRNKSRSGGAKHNNAKRPARNKQTDETEASSSKEQDDATEKDVEPSDKPKRTRRRGGRNRNKAETLEHGNDEVNPQQPENTANNLEPEKVEKAEEEHRQVKEGSPQQPHDTAPSSDDTPASSIDSQSDTSSHAKEATTEAAAVPEDTPPAENKRKGWWQRVLES